MNQETSTPVVKDVTKVKKAPKGTKKAKVAKPVGKKVTAATLRKIDTSVKKAEEVLAPLPTTKKIAEHAAEGIAQARKVLGTEPVGKYSPVGHLMGFQNGELDRIILTSETPDFGAWIKAVAKANCASRKTAPEDNAGLVKRLGSHLRTLSGQKNNNLRRALKRVGKDAQHDEIAGYFTPVCLMFQEYAGAAKF